MITHSVHSASFISSLRKAESDTQTRAKRAVEITAREAVNHARELTNNTKPGVNPGDGVRYTHPGGWADVTGNLANSIQAGKAKLTPAGVKAEFGVLADIEGTMEYAAELDERDGYSVLGGADAVAQKALTEAAKEILR